MVFSSPIFLFWFLPLVLLIYYLSAKKFRNYVLLFFSLLFYGWGEGEMMVVMLTSIVLNYLFGIWVDATEKAKTRKIIMLLFVISNLGLLMYFKYANFFAYNYNWAAKVLGVSQSKWEKVVLPLGISFFTFHGMSYVIDIYRKEIKVQKNPLDLALYISFFPQLIAGPIVRYKEIGEQLANRFENTDMFVEGIRRFVIGLAKKVLIANQVATVAEMVFSTPIESLGADTAWIGLIAVSIQIYFDFSGYSDMAIGLAKMFGFNFPENFIFPLSSGSMREFWTRWHISLSNWFRDYVFIPLGGSRKGNLRTQLNLWIIFLLMGFWHGAEWVYVAFGIWHGTFLVIERAGLEHVMKKIPFLFKNIYVWTIYMIGNIIFSSPDLKYAVKFTGRLFTSLDTTYSPVWLWVNAEFIFIAILALVLNYPIHTFFRSGSGLLKNKAGFLYQSASYSFILILLLLCMAQMANSTYNPFIYFRF